MNSIFLDTVGLIALWDEDDDWHEPAVKAFQIIAAEKIRTLTTSYIFLECGNAAARRPYRSSVDRLRENLELAGAVTHPTEEDWRQAWAAYRKGDGGQAGIVDQISFIVMKRLGISRVFSNDRHFQAAGFETLF